MSDSADKPIVSTRADDTDLEERIDAFVFSLGDRIDGLQDLEADGALAALAEDAEAFGRESETLGYEPLWNAARHLVAACRENNPDAARKGVENLTALSTRVRMGHRAGA